MTDHSREHPGRRQLLVMAAVLLGATLLLVGLLPPQVAQGKEQQEQQIPTPPQVAQGREQQLLEESAAPPAQGNEQAQKERVLDKDPQGNEVVAGELLVTYKKGASKQAKEEAPKKVGGKVEKDFPTIDVQHLSLPEVKNERSREARQKALERKKKDLEQHPDVKAVDYNYVREGTMVPNDPLYNSQWLGPQWGFPKISAPQAWDYTQGSSNVRVAILDSGIDMNHPELKGKVVAQYDYVNNDYDATDDRGHGTHVAGTVAARTNNKDASGQYVGVAGTCPNCSLINAKVLDANNGYANDVGIIYAIHFAVYHKAKVINMSFGGTGYSGALMSAVDYAWNNGIVLVGSAGNDGNDGLGFYPAAYENVIAVAATDKDDARATWDDPKTTDVVEKSNAGNWVDVAAPGKDILSTTPTYASTCMPNPCYQKNYDGTFSGTSMAAPHVSGLAALLLSKDGLISNAQVRNEIESRAWDLGATGKDPVFGHGRINAHGSVYLMKPTTYQQDSSKITYGSSGDWQTYHWSDYQGTYTYTNWASRSGATAKLSFFGNSVTWWANRGPYGGKAKVYVDGVLQDADPTLAAPGTQPVDLYSARNEPTQPAFSKTWGSTHGSHTIEIVVEGTSGRPWVDVDAFTVVQPNYCYAMSCT